MLKSILTLASIGFLFFGCSNKAVQNQQSVLVTMKTQQMKFSDMGFLYDGTNVLKMEIYTSGQPLVDLEINSQNICLSLLTCMDKKEFNQQVLNEHYPETLLENVFRAKPIFNAQHLEKHTEGFSQTIFEAAKYDIEYKVVRGDRVFRDKINKILIKVREIE